MDSEFTKPLGEIFRGISAFPRGLQWLFRNKFYLLALTVPLCSGVVVFVASFVIGFSSIKSWIVVPLLTTLFGDFATETPLYFAGLVFSFLILLLIAILLSTVVVSILSAPIYEYVSVAVEREFLGKDPPSMTLWRSVLLIMEEIRKAFVVFLAPLVVALLPVVNVLAPFVAAFCLGWDFCDYPMARRGWLFRQRFRFVRQEFFSVMGFGLWLLIPLLSLFIMPLAVVGGTILNLEAMQRRKLLDRVSF